MEENKAEHKASSHSNNTGVIELFTQSWNVVKKNFKELAIITLIGVVINVIITALFIFILFNNFINDADNAIASGLITGGVVFIASIFVGLFQVVALKKAFQNKQIIVSEVLSESWKFVPISLQYALFVFGIVITTGILMGLFASAAGPLIALFGFAITIAIIIAVFRYAFMQFLVIEDAQYAFLERFKVSQKLTSGIYGTLLLVWLMSVGLVIAGSIVSNIVSSPFSNSTTDKINSVSLDLSDTSSVDDVRKELKKAKNEVANKSFTANYVISEIINQSIVSGVSLIVLGALLQLYTIRKKKLLSSSQSHA